MTYLLNKIDFFYGSDFLTIKNNESCNFLQNNEKKVFKEILENFSNDFKFIETEIIEKLTNKTKKIKIPQFSQFFKNINFNDSESNFPEFSFLGIQQFCLNIPKFPKKFFRQEIYTLKYPEFDLDKNYPISNFKMISSLKKAKKGIISNNYFFDKSLILNKCEIEKKITKKEEKECLFEYFSEDLLTPSNSIILENMTSTQEIEESLEKKIIPLLVKHLKALHPLNQFTCLSDIKAVVHFYGVNLCYLGLLYTELENSTMQKLITNEMIARTIKNIILNKLFDSKTMKKNTVKNTIQDKLEFFQDLLKKNRDKKEKELEFFVCKIRENFDWPSQNLNLQDLDLDISIIIERALELINEKIFFIANQVIAVKSCFTSYNSLKFVAEFIQNKNNSMNKEETLNIISEKLGNSNVYSINSLKKDYEKIFY